MSFSLSRRAVLASLAATAASGTVLWPAAANAAEAPAAPSAPATDNGATFAVDGPFTRSTVHDIAQKLAQSPFQPPPTADLPKFLADLTYDQYRALYFRPEAALWAADGLPFQIQLLPRGFFYKERIEVATVDGGQAHHVAYSPDMYAPGAIVPGPLPTQDIGFSGVRVHGHINSPDHLDEFVVFQGASYFRAIGKGQLYGISARGLALNIGSPQGEEFPIFRAFWIEKPGQDAAASSIHALLDSRTAVTGAYRFTVRPGPPTVIDVEATLFPRVDLDAVGLAPGTSMFYFDANGRAGFDDWRPQVHDSDGLLIVNGGGERLWRPLANPKTLQFSAFVDSGAARLRPDAARPRLRRLPGLHGALREAAQPVGRADRRLGQGLGRAGRDPSRLGDQRQHRRLLAAGRRRSPPAPNIPSPTACRWGTGPAVPGIVVAATRRGRGDLRHASPVRRFVIDYVDTGVAVATDDPAAAKATAKPAIRRRRCRPRK